MKKLIVAMCIAVMGVSAANAGDFIWNWWTTSNEGSALKSDLTGCSLGIASELKKVKGAQIDLLFNKSEEIKSGAQCAIGYTRTGTLRNGAQVAFFNRAKSSALQIGLVCINETGFLPVFVFFNFDAKMFGNKR